MKVLIYLGHPAHFHLFKNVILNLKKDGHKVFILITKKDVLEQLLINENFEYHCIAEGRKNNRKLGLINIFLKRVIRTFFFSIKNKPDILCGSSDANSIIGPLLHIPVINVGEDDAAIIPLYTHISYPGSSVILNPSVCNCGKWTKKTIKYDSYHELAYLHPNHFTPNKTIKQLYISSNKPFVIIRFSKLSAHHDKNITGINDNIALNLINQIIPNMDVYITSEKPLSENLEQYRITINPLHMHDVLAYASILIGDSQTMAAEAAVLGTPYIRFNNFVGKIGYLNELENKYHLGYGITTNQVDKLYTIVNRLLKMENRHKIFSARRTIMLKDKIDYAKFLTWFIENYPQSKTIMSENPQYQLNFK